MITSYSTLKTSITNFLRRSDLESMIPEFIADAEERIYSELRIACMEDAFSSTIANGVVALPTGFLEWKFLYVDGSSADKLQRKDPEWIYTNYPTRGASGEPRFFSREGDNVIFGPYPDSAYTIKGRYYKRLTALSDSNTSNWFITNAPSLLRYGALCEAAPYVKDDKRIPIWEGKFADGLRRLKKTEEREAVSGSLLAVTRG